MSEKDSDTLVLDPETHEKVDPVVEEEKKDSDDPDDIRRRATAPPKRGMCRRCNLNKPINQLMLCYRCWVITNLEDQAKKRGESWHEGDPHPDGCGCVGLGEHKSPGGSSVWNN